MHIETGGHHSGAIQQGRTDFTDPFGCDSRHGDNRFTSFTGCCTPDKVQLSSTTTVEFASQRVGVYLAGEVDRKCRVDGSHFRLLGNDIRIVGIAYVHHSYCRVVVDKVIYRFRTHQESRNDFPFIVFFIQVVDYSFIIKR